MSSSGFFHDSGRTVGPRRLRAFGSGLQFTSVDSSAWGRLRRDPRRFRLALFSLGEPSRSGRAISTAGMLSADDAYRLPWSRTRSGHDGTGGSRETVNCGLHLKKHPYEYLYAFAICEPIHTTLNKNSMMMISSEARGKLVGTTAFALEPLARSLGPAWKRIRIYK